MGANKTPSSNSTTTDALDELIDIIAGGAEKEEHLLKQISSKLNKSTLGKIISESLNAQVELLTSAANMLCAIAGYLYGEKGVNVKSSAGELLGKVKNNSPILGDKPVSEAMAEAGGGKKEKEKGAFDFILKFEGITGGDVNALKDILMTLKEVASEEDIADIEAVTDTAKVLECLVTEIGKIDFSKISEDTTKSIIDLGIMVDELKLINKNLLKGLPTMVLLQNFNETLQDFPRIIAEFISGNNGKGGLVMIMNRINKAEENGLDPRIIGEFFENVIPLMQAVTKVGLLSIICGMTAEHILKAGDTLSKVIDAIAEIKIDVVIRASKTVENAATFVRSLRDIYVGLALIGLFAIPAVVGLVIIMVSAKLLFKVLKAVIDGINSLGKIEDIKLQIKDVAMVILVLGVLLLVAALVGGWVVENAGNILGFAGVLCLFITLLLIPFALFSTFGGQSLEDAQEMGILIAICAGVMILGALFMLTGLWVQALLFGPILMAFLVAVLLPLFLFTKFGGKSIENAKDLGLMVAILALTMMLGAVFMKSGLWKEALMFAGVLAGFMMAVFMPLVFLSKRMRKTLKDVKGMVTLIITCTIVLMIGALFMLTGWWKEALMFAGILGAFIFLVVLPFGLFGKDLKKAMPSMWALTVLIIVSTVVLLIGASYIRDNGFVDALIFAGLIVGFITILGTAAWILAKIQKDVFKGLLVITCIVAIVGLFTIILGEIADIMNTADVDKMFIAVGVIAAIIVALGALSVAMGALTLIPFFWMGLAAVAAVAGIALILSQALKNIGEAAKMLAEANNLGFDPAGAMSIIGSMVAIGQAVGAAAIALPTGLILFASISFMAMAKMISKIGIAVADISNLTVATEWNSEGVGTKFRQLNKTDFENAATNTEIIITTLGGAICKTYKENKELFATPPKGGIAGFFGATETSPFDKVVRSCTGLGRMISLIAEGVANMANLTVATDWNENGQPIKFRTLKTEDFAAAAINTSLIVSVLGNAICKLYNDQKHLFEVPDVVVKVGFIKITKKGTGPTIFEKVVKACSSMGQMISSIAAGVGDMADLKVADQWNSEGAPVHYRYLNDSDFKAAATNTSTIVRALGTALSTTYNENKEMFDTDYTFVDGKIQSDTPISRVINAGRGMGEMVSSIAAGVQDIANLRMPIKWDKDGQPCEWREMTEDDFTKAGVQVSLITSVLSKALGKTYKDNPQLFDPVTTLVKTKDGLFSDEYATHTEDAPMVKVLKAAGGLGKFVGECAQAVKEVGDLSFEDKNGKKVQIKAGDLTQTGYIAKNVVSIVTCLPKALGTAYKQLPDGTLGDAQYFNDSLLPAISGVTEQYSEIITKNAELKAATIEQGVNNFTNAISGLLQVFKNEDTVLDDTFKQTLSAVKSSIAEIKTIEVDKELFGTIEDIQLFAKKLEKLNFKLDPKNVEGLSCVINSVIKPFAAKYNKVNSKTVKDFKNIITPVNLAGIQRLISIVEGVDINKEQIAAFVGLLKGTIKVFNRRTNAKNIANIKQILSKDTILTLGLLNKITHSVKPASVTNFTDFIEDVAVAFKRLGNTKIQFDKIALFGNNVFETSIFARKFFDTFAEYSDDYVDSYNNLVFGILTPFESIKLNDIFKYKSTFNSKTTKNVSVLTKSINALNDNKVDKFIELSQELRELSETVGDIGGLVDALNGRINETLTKLSDSLENASDTIRESDKVQDKRQKLIQKNTKQLTKVLSQPMKLELSKAASSKSGAKPSGSKSGVGSGSGSSESGSHNNGGGSLDVAGFNEAVDKLIQYLRGVNQQQ